MSEFYHTIDKKNEDCELFEDIFELKISTNIKEYFISRLDLNSNYLYVNSNIF